MITVSSKAKTAPQQSSLLNLKSDKGGKSDKKEGSSFIQILQTLSTKSTTENKGIKNGVLLLKTADTAKKTDLASLLKTSKDEKYTIDPKIVASLDTASLKQVLSDAKQYLKDKIKNSPEFQIKNIKKMPNTIQGLLKLAKNLHIDVSKITLSKVMAKQTNTKSLQPPTVQIKETQIKEIQTTPTLKKAQTDSSQKTAQNTATTTTTTLENLMQTKVATTPLFQKSAKTVLKHSTIEIVNSKTTKTDSKSNIAVVKSDILANLLHAPQNAKADTLKVAQAPLNAPFLHVKGKQDSSNDVAIDTVQPLVKHDGITHTSSIDTTFSVKIHEAKQMIKYLAHDVKQAIENYKPPFTKIEVKLNPQKFGAVDLTVVQRGKNLHVSISSNSTAITALAQNANDLKVQLNQNGINNASLNFNSSGNLADNSNQQQQQQQQEHAKRQYQQFADAKTDEEHVASLEIVVPQYI